MAGGCLLRIDGDGGERGAERAAVVRAAHQGGGERWQVVLEAEEACLSHL
jgi:hypothetical protein